MKANKKKAPKVPRRTVTSTMGKDKREGDQSVCITKPYLAFTILSINLQIVPSMLCDQSKSPHTGERLPMQPKCGIDQVTLGFRCLKSTTQI